MPGNVRKARVRLDRVVAVRRVSTEQNFNHNLTSIPNWS
jgi:hypothetical protein